MALLPDEQFNQSTSVSNFTFGSEMAVPMFGTYTPTLGIYPNDCVLLDVYNFTNDYLETIPRATFVSRDQNVVSINVEEELKAVRYYSGKYNITARFHRNIFGSLDGDKLVIQEISSDRLEIRVTPYIIIDRASNNFESFFEDSFFGLEKNSILPNLYVFSDTFTGFKVFDYVQDPFTFQNPPFSIIFKLSAPLPNDITVDTLVWVAQELSAPVSDGVTVIPTQQQRNVRHIAGPNFDIESSDTTNLSTDYRSWNDVLSTNTDTSLAVLNRLFSGSYIEGTELNIDFKKFENFVHFGSAEERLRNFKYKLELIEYYDSRVQSLSQSYNLIPGFNVNSDLTGSAEFVANILDAKTKKSQLIGAFDTYEKYLYYQSSSYETSSFGEFYPTTWPKLNSSKPYINYSTTSSQAEEWFEGIIQSASSYDLNNIHTLRKLIPEYIYISENNDQYILFVDMIGHYFDLIYAYISQLTSINKRYESITEGFAKDLVYQIGHSLGLNAENGFMTEELWSYFLGTTASGSLVSPTYAISIEDKTKEVWKRIITNLPYLLKTKGTSRGIRALINCYGIPSTILRVREYGGPEPTFYTATQEEYDQFYYGLYLSGSSTITAATHGAVPEALEIRFRIHSSSLNSNTAFQVLTGPTTITANPFTGTVVAGGQTISNVPLSELDTDWWTVLINRGGRAYIGSNRYGKALIYSSSTATATLANASAVIPGASNRLNGYVNEYRLWSRNLDLEVYENHILAPTSFQGPQDDKIVGSTSSFDTLKVRHTLGADGKKFNASVYTIISSSHPNQFNIPPTATLANFTSDTSSYWIPQVETHYLEVVDGGPNRKVGNKIRIESGLISSSNQVQTNSSILKSLQDTYPVESPRVTVAFSPTDEVDEDINEQFGGYSLDDFLGDPADYYNDSYTGLDKIKNEYFKKYKKRNDTQGFIRLIENYDSSLFQLVKQFVPERALLHTGLVVESHALHRNKVGQKKPSIEDLYLNTSLTTYDDIWNGENLTYTSSISAYDDNLNGDYNTYNGLLTQNDTVDLSGEDTTFQTSVPSTETNANVFGAINEFGTLQVLELQDSIYVGYPDAAQYQYYNWFQTGSGQNDWVYGLSVGEDIWNPIQPVILQNRLSNIYNTETDRFNGLLEVGYLNYIVNIYSIDYAKNLISNIGFEESVDLALDSGTGNSSISTDYVLSMTYNI